MAHVAAVHLLTQCLQTILLFRNLPTRLCLKLAWEYKAIFIYETGGCGGKGRTKKLPSKLFFKITPTEKNKINKTIKQNRNAIDEENIACGSVLQLPQFLSLQHDSKTATLYNILKIITD